MSADDAERSAMILQEPAGTEHNLRGYVDGIWNGALQGWAWLPNAPAGHARVKVFVDDRLIGEVAADSFRQDLADGAIGHGYHGFTLRMPTALQDGEAHRVEVIELSSGLPLDKAASEMVFRHPDAFYSELFDIDFYCEQAGPLADPITHYVTTGWKEGFNPHPLFDTQFYIKECGEQIDKDPLSHFLTSGKFKFCEVHPLFDVSIYMKARPDVSAAGLHPLLHYIRFGIQEDPHAYRFFDGHYYVSATAGLSEIGFTPLLHYLKYGFREGRRPHPDFDPQLFKSLVDLPDFKDPFTHFAHWLLARFDEERERPVAPRVSIVILNLSKTLVTLQCLYFLDANAGAIPFEIVILDNGSRADQFALLYKYRGAAQLIRVNTNRGFGEGNNIASEYTSGDYLLFLNNDVFVTPGWLAPLVAVLDDNLEVGAAGPKFLYPDGRLQEAGAMIAPCGIALQRGKNLDGSCDIYDRLQDHTVDYCSAAALIIRSEDFIRILGYDLIFDPAYYEDADLCLKLRLIGKKTVYVPTSKVYHVENGTSSDKSLNLKLHDIVSLNRLKFVGRWSEFLSGASDGTAERRRVIPVELPMVAEPKHGRVGLYTPYPLYPGGGERYLLTIASVLRTRFECFLITPEPVSRLRLNTMARELNVNLDGVQLLTWNQALEAEKFAIFIAMGNEVLPPVPALGNLNIFHCQFPFPMSDHNYTNNASYFDGYSVAIVNSEFTRANLIDAQQKLGLKRPEIRIINPPVPQYYPGNTRKSKVDRTFRILNVGRFSRGGHCKRQDVMIECLHRLAGLLDRPIELHLAGSLGPDSASRIYLAELQSLAKGLPVRFHVNASHEQVMDLYGSADIYWHITGINNNIEREPALYEHFGITIAEAMSAGVVPIVLAHGGPAEIVEDGRSGYLITTREELINRTLSVADMDRAAFSTLAENAKARAAQFSPESFSRHIEGLIYESKSVREM